MLSDILKSTAPHIVIANEDPEECKLFKEALEKLNISCNVSIIQNEAMLLNLLNQRDFTPDFIFWDLEVPCIDVHCLELIKKRKKVRSIPVIIFSKSVNPHNKDYCYNTRANEYFLRALSFLL